MALLLSEEVQVLNAEGIDMMGQGRLTEAAEAFSHAISQLSWCVLTPTPITTTRTVVRSIPQVPRISSSSSSRTTNSSEEEEEGKVIAVNVKRGGTASNERNAQCGQHSDRDQDQHQHNDEEKTLMLNDEKKKKKNENHHKREDTAQNEEEDIIMEQQEAEQEQRDNDHHEGRGEIDVNCLGQASSLDPRRDDFFSKAFYFQFRTHDHNHHAPFDDGDEDDIMIEDDAAQEQPQPASTTTCGSSSLTSDQHLGAAVCCLFNQALCSHIKWQRREFQGAQEQEATKQQSQKGNQKKNMRMVIPQEQEGDDEAGRPTAAQAQHLLLLDALQHYEEALSLAQNAYTTFNVQNRGILSRPQDPIFTVLMALCTNSTHCHRELGNIEEAIRWNHLLCQILAFRARAVAEDDSVTRAGGNGSHDEAGISRAAPQNHDDDNHDFDHQDERRLSLFFSTNAHFNRILLVPPSLGGAARAA